MLKVNQNEGGEPNVDNISSSRYISHVSTNGNGFHPPSISAQYIGETGVLFQADCLDLLANIRNDSVDLVFVDPPFNLGKDYATPEFKDDMAAESYRGWCRTWLLELVRVLRPGGALFLYHWPKWLMDLGAWMNSLHYLEYRAWIALKMKSGFPIRGRIHPAHYGMVYYTKIGKEPTFNVVRTKSPTCRHCGKLIRDYGGYRDKFKRFEDSEGIPWIQISDFWDDTRPARQDKTRDNQVNELPLHIPDRAILMASNPGDIILDCFAGGGSSIQAAHANNRLWIAADIGKPTAALRRIATFISPTDCETPPSRIEACFTKKFRDSLLQVDPQRGDRPIKQVGAVIADLTSSKEKYASKSKVLGY